MGRIVATNGPLLKEEGFRKRRHSFNRGTADGLVHVVNFWMAPKEPPGWTRVPGLRERMYANFRIDFGVYVPAMKRSSVPKSDWINEYDCQLRRTMGELMTPDDRVDLWWSLEDEQAQEKAREAILEYGLPWLNQFHTGDSVLERFTAVGPTDIGMNPAGDLDIAEMLTAMGRTADARRILEEYVERSMPRNHAGYLAEYLLEIGQADLVPSIRLRSATTD